MIKLTQISYRTPVYAVLLTLWMASSVAADCGYFKPLGDLAEQMQQVATGQAPRGAETARQVARHVRDVDLVEVRRRLLEMNLSAHIRNVVRLVAFAKAYSEMRTIDTVALARNVHAVNGLFDIVCDSQLAVGEVDSNPSSIMTGYLDSFSESTRIFLKTGMVLAFLSGVIGLLWALRYAVLRIIGLVNHKKTCRISAQICGDKQIFAGTVTRAGLIGVRFEFQNDAEAQRLANLMASPKFIYFDLLIDVQHWPVFVDQFQTFFVPLYFLEKLDRNELGDILAKSTCAIRSAPAIGHKSNRRLWSAGIKERKAKIRNTYNHRMASK